MPKVVANGITMHYWQSGRGEDVVLIHGMGGNLAMWHMEIGPALQQEYRITTYDIRGHGRTDIAPTGYTMQSLSEDLRCLMDTLGIQRAQLVGHSLGGDIALHFAFRYPQRVHRAVVMEAMFPPLASWYETGDDEPWSYWARLLQRLLGIEVPPDKVHDLQYLIDNTLDVPVMYGPMRGQLRLKEPLQRLVNDTTALEDIKVVGDLPIENLTLVTTPILLLYESDSLVLKTYHLLRQHLPNCTARLLPPSQHKHFMHLERPELIVQAISEFFQTGTVTVEALEETDNYAR